MTFAGFESVHVDHPGDGHNPTRRLRFETPGSMRPGRIRELADDIRHGNGKDILADLSQFWEAEESTVEPRLFVTTPVSEEDDQHSSGFTERSVRRMSERRPERVPKTRDIRALRAHRK
jgi:hypothetical protein